MVDPIGTVPALDLLTQDQLDQLFDSTNGYMSKVDETFSILDAIDDAGDANNPQNKNGNNNDPKSGDDPPNGDNNDNKTNNSNDNSSKSGKSKYSSHKHTRTASLLTMDRKTLILDVDNTLIYVRHFMDEMRVNDTVKLGDKQARVKKLTYRLDLEFAEGGQMSTYDHIITSADEHIPQRSDWFPDEITKVALIHQADPTGCEIELLDEYEDSSSNNNNTDDDNSNTKTNDSNTNNSNNSNNNNNNDKTKNGSNNETKNENNNPDNKTQENNDTGGNDENNDNSNNNNNNTSNNSNNSTKKLKTYEISFLKNSKELSQLEPMMNRQDHVEVDFMYGGYLVRIRPNLAKFLANCNTMFDVILFTAADGSVYKGLLHQVHELLKQKLSEIKDDLEVPDPAKLWSEIYFRDDCDEKFDEHGLPYRHKNLAKLGRDLSTIVMVDDNPLSYRGYEPNAVRVAGFWGQAHPVDSELTKSLLPTLRTVSKHKDVRYHLSGLEAPSDNDESDGGKNNDGDPKLATTNEIEHQRKHSRKRSSKFLESLKKALDEDNLDDENENDDDDDDDNDDDSLGDSSSGKDLEQGANAHEKDQINGLLPQPKPATRSKKQQIDAKNGDAIMSDEELTKLATYSRGHSDSVRIRNDVNDTNNETNDKNKNNNGNTDDILDLFDNDKNDTNNNNTENGKDSKRSSMASSVGGVVFYGMDDNLSSPVGRPLQVRDGNNHNREDSDVGQHILQPSTDNILQFEPITALSATDIISNDDKQGGRRNSVEMDDIDKTGNETNRRESVSGDQSQSQSETGTNTNDNSDRKDNEEDTTHTQTNLTVTNGDDNNTEAKSNHMSHDSAALNAKYGFVSVNGDSTTTTTTTGANNNTNNNEETISPAYVSSGNVVDNNDTNQESLNVDSHYPLTDEEDVTTGSSSCLCFSLFSKKKKQNKYARTAPMANQELR